MLTRLKSLTAGLPFQAAHCFDRLVATQLSGFFYFLGGIAKVPWKHIFGGTVPAVVTATLSASAFIYKLRQTNNPSCIDTQLLTKDILCSLRQHAHSLKLSAEELNCVLHENDLDEMLPILRKISSRLENTKLQLSANVWSSIIHCMSHFHELLLLRNYTNYEPLKDYELSEANILTFCLLLFAIYSGYHHFRIQYEKDKNPSTSLLLKSIMHHCQQEVSETSFLLNNSTSVLSAYSTFK